MKRVLSVISALGGAGIIAYSVYLMAIGIFTGDYMTRNMVFLAIGAVVLAAGVWGNIAVSIKNRDLPEEQRARSKKKRKTAAIIVGTLAVFTVFGLALPVALSLLSERETEARIEEKLRPMMKDEYSQIGVPMPENAKYILHNRNSGEFETDSNSLLKGLSSNPSRVSVVVEYQTAKSEIGYWETESGLYLDVAYEETMDIAVIRLSDWSLIEEKTFTAVRSDNRLGEGDEKYTYQISLYDDEILHYLNGLFAVK